MSIRQKIFINNILNLILPVSIVAVLVNMWRRTSYYSHFGLFLLIGIFMGVVIINLIMTYYISKSISEPLNLLINGLNKIGEGELDFSIEYNSSNEFGVMIKKLDQLRHKLKITLEENQIHRDRQSEVTASIVHDLKTPISNILGYCEGIIDGIAKTEEKKLQYINIIHERAKQLNLLVNNLFIISKFDMNNVPTHLEEIDLTLFLNKKYEEYLVLAEKSDFVINNIIGENKINVMASPKELERVLDNILENCIKYKSENKLEVIFQLQENNKNNSVIIKIIDNGIGVSVEEEESIFEQFYRNDKARTSGDGSGLGLYTSKRIINSMNGKIWCHHNKEAGMTIYISFKKV